MFKQIGEFVGQTKQELKKVTWPGQNEVWQSTLVVISTTFLMGFFIGVTDFLLSNVMRFLIG